MPLVSICIPTYNRVNNLEKTIESIVNKNEFLNGKVELVISDNNSTDNTENLCNKYKKYDNFKYYKNDKNLIDENFYLVLKRGNGVFRKLHNDSFTFNNEGLSYICEKVEKYSKSKPSLFFTTGALKLDNDECNYDFPMTIKKISYWFTCLNFIGFWETDIKDINYNKELFSKCLWQTVNSIRILKNKNNAIICNALVGTQLHIENKDVSYGIYNVFHNNFLSILNKYVNDNELSVDIVDCIEKDLLFNKFLFDLVSIKTGLINEFNNENFEEDIINGYSKKEYWNEFRKKYQKELFIRKIKEKIKILIKKK